MFCPAGGGKHPCRGIGQVSRAVALESFIEDRSHNLQPTGDGLTAEEIAAARSIPCTVSSNTRVATA